MKHVQIIAEVGECFNGNMGTAHEMISVAKDCGCDTVKFQLLDMDEVSGNDPEYDWFKKIELDRTKIDQLISWAKEEEIDILFTPVSVKTAKWLVEYGQDQVKIASSFVKKNDLLEYINDNFKLVYASTGMASIDEVKSLVSRIDKPVELRLLHCVSEYPTGPLLEKRGLVAMQERDAHLEMMTILRSMYPDHKIGYSDHSDDVFVPVVATAMGADIIEKHITLDKTTPIDHFNRGLKYMGTDHVVSIEPEQLRKMVEYIRRVEIIKGDRVWKRSEGECILLEFLQERYKKREKC